VQGTAVGPFSSARAKCTGLLPCSTRERAATLGAFRGIGARTRPVLRIRPVDPRSDELERLLAGANAGDESARAELFTIVYAELRQIAGVHLRGAGAHTLQPTALVHEAILKLALSDSGFNDRAHVLAIAATAMRQIVMNHARDRRAAKRGGAWNRVVLEEDVAASGTAGDLDLVALDDALSELALIDERKHRVVELRFFAGLSVEEVAGVLGRSTTTVESEWRAAKAWLGRKLGAP
jgi:RNA polymerase sigma-70 factor, ECF subfamily